MSKVVSEDSVGRSFSQLDEAQGVTWLQNSSQQVYALLFEPWILDADAAVEILYGRQEGSEVGYNLHKPGRLSHTYHTDMIANLGLILEVEVHSGKQIASKYSSLGLWALLDRLSWEHWPRTLICGDRDWGTAASLQPAERAGLPYLFKLCLTKRTRQLIERLMSGRDWVEAGQGWQGSRVAFASERLESHARRVIVLRRRIKKDLTDLNRNQPIPINIPRPSPVDH